MYYRVKKFIDSQSNMYVIDEDNNLDELKLRTHIDYAGIGPKKFINSKFIESQQIKCVDLAGKLKNSDIIEEDNQILIN